MRTLVSLLEAAFRRAADEVTLESDQPVIYQTPRGSEAEQELLGRTQLFDMLAAAVTDELQVELMLGNAIEFELQAGDDWTVRAVPGADAMVVRAERHGNVQVPYRLTSKGQLQIELEASGGEDTDFDFDVESEPSAAVTRREPVLVSSPGDGLELPPLGDQVALGASFESGTWTLDDDDDPMTGEPGAPRGQMVIPESGPGQLPSGFPSPPEPAYDLDSDVPLTGDADDAFIGVPDDDDEPLDPFISAPVPPRTSSTGTPTLRGSGGSRPNLAAASPTRSPTGERAAVGKAATVKQPALGKPTTGKQAAIAKPANGKQPMFAGATALERRRTVNEFAGLVSPQAQTIPEIRAVAKPDADTHRELPSVVSKPEAIEFAADIGEGCLVYLTEPGLAEHLAQALQAPAVMLDDDVDPAKLWPRIRSLPPGSIIIIKREDPSVLLGWVLRRLEEGYRVFLETRASTPVGARRILLGLQATTRAEEWLDALTQIVVEPGVEGPTLRWL